MNGDDQERPEDAEATATSEAFDELDEVRLAGRDGRDRQMGIVGAVFACLFLVWCAMGDSDDDKAQRSAASKPASPSHSAAKSQQAKDAEYKKKLAQKARRLQTASPQWTQAALAAKEKLAGSPDKVGQWNWKPGVGAECAYTLLKTKGRYTMHLICHDSKRMDKGDRLRVTKTGKGLKMKVVGGQDEYFILTDSGHLESYDEVGRVFRLRPR